MKAQVTRLDDTLDPQPGQYYVSVFDPSDNVGHGRLGLLLGPFRSHRDAVDRVQDVRAHVETQTPWADFWAFGTVRMADSYDQPGRLNSLLERKAS